MYEHLSKIYRKCSFGLRSGVEDVVLDLHNFHPHQCKVDVGGVLLDETTPIRIEMFPHGIKVNGQ